jgi:hypothetical protein
VGVERRRSKGEESQRGQDKRRRKEREGERQRSKERPSDLGWKKIVIREGEEGKAERESEKNRKLTLKEEGKDRKRKIRKEHRWASLFSPFNVFANG